MRMIAGRHVVLGLLAVGCLQVTGCAEFVKKLQQGNRSSSEGSAQDKARAKKALEEFEKLEPDEAELRSNTTDAWEAAKTRARELNTDIVTAFDGEEQRALLERKRVAWRNYCVKASQISLEANNANQAFWVLLPFINDSYKYDKVDDEVIKAARESAKRRGVFRQDEAKKYKSYAADGNGGNCVFATKSFGGDGTTNPDLGYYFTGRTKLFVRCFSEDDVTNYSGPDGKFYVRVQINEYYGLGKPAGVPSDYPKGSKVIEASFDIPFDPIDKDDFAVLSGKMGFQQISGYVWEGNNQVPNYVTRELASSTAFWEKKPKPL